jgi:tetratricopeptide (TPR) repeat protein
MALRRMVILPRRGLRRDTSDVITLADHARDAGEWERGAELYRNALDRYPRNSGIWVQYGHALKESGELRDPEKLAQAEAAYRRALSLDPSVADTHLQLGHVLKLQDKIEEARGAYLRAFVLDRSLDSASLELAQLGWSEVHFSQLRSMLGTECIGAPETPPCAFILNSLQHLTQLEDGSFLTTGHDPQFALITSDGHLPHGSILFTVETKEADPLLRPTLYVWGGETGEEITSFSLPIMWSALVSETAIQLPQRVTAMRLDPADQAGVSFKLGSVAFSRLPALPEPSLSAPSRTDYDLWVRLYDSLHQEDTDAIRYHIAHLAVRPLLSVVMSVHNPDPHYIRCALDSVLGQLYGSSLTHVGNASSSLPAIR